MPYELAPPPHLAGRVAAFWVHEGHGGPCRILPDGCMDFWFDLASGKARVIGTMTEASVVLVPERARFFGMRFRPGAAADYLTDAVRDFVDGAAPLADVTHAGRAALPERVATAKDDAARIAILSEYLLASGARVRPSDHRVRRAAELLRADTSSAPVRSVAAALGLGERQLERLFSERVGIGPKQFARVARMERAVALIGRAPQRGQAWLASAAGYADESHLIREFHSLAGVTPANFANERHAGFMPSG